MGNSLINGILFQPPELTYLHPSRRLWLKTKNGERISAVYVDQPGATLTVLFSHGNAEDLGMLYGWAHGMSQMLRVNMLLYDYRGYGNSEGVPSEENCYEDIEAAYSFLVNDMRKKPSQIVLYGRSLGSGPSCYLACRSAADGKSVGGLVLQSPLLSAYRVAISFGTTMPGDPFPNVDLAPYIKCPVFVIHGTLDEIVPFWHGQQLIAAVRDEYKTEPFWVEGAKHNNIESKFLGELLERLNNFLDTKVSARFTETDDTNNAAQTSPSSRRGRMLVGTGSRTG